MRISSWFGEKLILIFTLSLGFHILPVSALNILLTNDDGVSSSGLAKVKHELEKKGHRIFVVAPSAQQSGSGMKITLGPISAKEIKENVWSISGTPADAVTIGLDSIYQFEKIDLVISGPNFGQNLGSTAYLSGTVGAAMTASSLGIPAIAVSVGIDLSEIKGKPVRFKSTEQLFGQVSSFLKEFLIIYENRVKEILPPNVSLNLNYPLLDKDDIKGVKVVKLAGQGGFEISRGSLVRGKSEINIKARVNESEENNDISEFNKGYITVTPLSLDWNASDQVFNSVNQRLNYFGNKF